MVPVEIIVPPDNPLPATIDVTVPPALGAQLALTANDAVVAKEDEIVLMAQLAVPKVDPLCVPINEPVKEPVLICSELLTVPVGKNAIT
jgi:hypothetical protein